MDFLTLSNVAFTLGTQAFLLGFGMYFLVLLVCRQGDLAFLPRLALTALTVCAFMLPEIYHMLFQSDPALDIADEAMAPAALWFAIKVKFWAGVCGHIAGWIVGNWFD